jgi:hypothetical protein
VKNIKDTGFVWVVVLAYSNGLIDKIVEISNIETSKLEELGRNGHQYALSHFTSEVSIPKVVDILEQFDSVDE